MAGPLSPPLNELPEELSKAAGIRDAVRRFVLYHVSPYPHVESSGAGCLGGFSGRIPREGVVELSSPFRRKSRLQLVESEGEECVCLRCVDSAVDGVAPS